MNPARTFGPDLVGADFSSYWVYIAGPLAGACVAVGVAYVLRGHIDILLQKERDEDLRDAFG